LPRYLSFDSPFLLVTANDNLMKKNHRALRITLISVFSVIVLLFSTFFIYVSIYYHADSKVDTYLTSTDEVEVTRGNEIVFTPKNKTVKAGLVFYPGAKVEATAYAPLCSSLAKEGILTYLIQMPYNLAFFDSGAGKGIPTKHPEVSHWYLSGHSLGGAMAASFIGSDTSEYEGLILLASYSTSDLSKTSLKTMTIYGSQDKVLNKSKYQDCLKNLPSSNREVILEGGNHSGYAYYGPQKGDGTASISKDEQIAKTVMAVTSLLA
jgi:hypothetical protein